MSKFYVGQKVECVSRGPGQTSICVGSVYLIRAIYCSRGDTFIALVGVKEGAELPGYFHWRFRPLEEKPDAIEWAREICRNPHKRILEPA